MSMRCPRCEGWMITTQFRELCSTAIVGGCRCLVCGETFDPVMVVDKPAFSLRKGFPVLDLTRKGFDVIGHARFVRGISGRI
jgi:hypothetical protein